MAKLGTQPKNADSYVDIEVIIYHIYQIYHNSCASIWKTHRISDFQVLALTGHIGNFKGVVLLDFLQRRKMSVG